MTVYLISMFGISLALTVAIELAIALLWGVRSLRGIVLVTLVNMLTNPLAVLLCWLRGMYLPALPEIPVQLALETAVIAAEAGIYRRFAGEPQWQLQRPILLSVTANLCAWLFGLAMTAL